MSKYDINDIKERLEAATQGDWYFEEDERCQQLFADAGNGFHPLQLFKAPKKSKEFAEYWLNQNDKDFVENAKKDMHHLIVIIESLEKELDNFRSNNGDSK